MKKVLIGSLVVGLVVLTALGVFAYQGYGGYGGMMGNAGMMNNAYRGGDMDEMHDYMVERVDPQTADYMNRMHESCPYRD
ncbi:MAG: hypothetical protein V1645_01650 [archaeon]